MKFSTIGILGGGQLGRMMIYAAHQLGMQVAVLDPDPEAPAGQIADRHVVGDFRDLQKILELAQGCDVITTEIEHINVDALDHLVSVGFNVQPAPQTFRLIQDKFAQKEHLQQHNLPLPLFMDTPDLDTVYKAAKQFGFPFLLKARRLAYDGRGNVVARQREAIPAAFEALGSSDLYAEKYVPFSKELAVMVARSSDGTLANYVTVETIQENNICKTVYAPASIPAAAHHEAVKLARQAVATFPGAGIFGVEMFYQPDGTILLNEIAPRPHNSGHYTIEACVTSQFEQHLRAILGLPLGDTSLKTATATMTNVLGADDNTLESTLTPIEEALNLPGTSIHWYGKRAVRKGRKMGHITTVKVQELPAQSTGKSAAQVGIIMGSDSDLPTMKQAAEILSAFEIPFELTIVSAHRTPSRMFEYGRTAHQRGLQVIIAGAGGAAHLPGMVAALTPLPVIGVPIRTEPLGGQDSLLSIVQMPKGIPVATVAIGNATNAGLLAVRMLAMSNLTLQTRLLAYQRAQEETVLTKVANLEQTGWQNYPNPDGKKA